MEEEVTAVDPLARQDLTSKERKVILHEEGVAEAEVPQTLREQLRARLPESWSEQEITQFISTYIGKIPEEVLDAPAAEVEEIATLVEEVDDTTLPVSSLSRSGYTLDTHVIIDGRSVSLRAIYDAGQLVPTKVMVTEGSRRNPRRAIQYGARVVDRNLFFAVTEETYKSLSKAYPQTVPHDEPLTARGVKNVQSKTTVLTADTMERVLPSV